MRARARLIFGSRGEVAGLLDRAAALDSTSAEVDTEQAVVVE